MRALILCAGNGTRLGYKTKPKCMAMVNKKPVLEHLVNHLNKAGITEIVINIHKNYEPIFKYFGTRLLYFYEPVLMGEHGTEKALTNWLGDEYIVMNGDTITNLSISHLIKADITTMFWNKDKDCYAGTKFVKKDSINFDKWFGQKGAYYYDIGTSKKLNRARRLLQ